MKPVIAVHGGAGDRSQADPRARAGVAAVERAVRAGSALLADGAAALDAVVAAVAVLEDDGSLNAGRGAVTTSRGTVELSASVMDGASSRAGAVAVLAEWRHAVELARRVLEEGRHVLFAGQAADALAVEWGTAVLRPAGTPSEELGTVGAVALDRDGHLASATSTGGIRGQHPGRIGDTPIVGAGTWADDRTCAVSATGDGDVFMRVAFAHDVHARVRYTDATLDAACAGALEAVRTLGGLGGCVAVDRAGNVATPFTTTSMLRAWWVAGHDVFSAIT